MAAAAASDLVWLPSCGRRLDAGGVLSRQSLADDRRTAVAAVLRLALVSHWFAARLHGGSFLRRLLWFLAGYGTGGGLSLLLFSRAAVLAAIAG